MGSPRTVAEDINISGYSREWTEKAACRGIEDPNIFFPTSEVDKTEKAKEKAAKEICRSCVVRNDCLSYAVETNQPEGIWGGQNHKELRSIRKRWLAEKRRRDS